MFFPNIAMLGLKTTKITVDGQEWTFVRAQDLEAALSHSDKKLTLRKSSTGMFHLQSGGKWADELNFDEALATTAQWLLGIIPRYLRTAESHRALQELMRRKRDEGNKA